MLLQQPSKDPFINSLTLNLFIPMDYSLDQVKICRNIQDGQYYAVKCIRKKTIRYFTGLLYSTETEEMSFLIRQNSFRDEIETNRKYYLIQKLIPGSTVSTYIRSYFSKVRHPQESMNQFIHILKQMTMCLDELHSQDC